MGLKSSPLYLLISCSKRISYAKDAQVNAARLVENPQSYLSGYTGMLVGIRA
jgi:hypothetical protein